MHVRINSKDAGFAERASATFQIEGVDNLARFALWTFRNWRLGIDHEFMPARQAKMRRIVADAPLPFVARVIPGAHPPTVHAFLRQGQAAQDGWVCGLEEEPTTDDASRANNHRGRGATTRSAADIGSSAHDSIRDRDGFVPTHVLPAQEAIATSDAHGSARAQTSLGPAPTRRDTQ
jgi:hypothetical protein